MLIASQGFRTCICVTAMWVSSRSSDEIDMVGVVGLEVVTVGSDVVKGSGGGGRGVEGAGSEGEGGGCGVEGGGSDVLGGGLGVEGGGSDVEGGGSEGEGADVCGLMVVIV